jgi:dCMP deaminase
MKNRRISKDEYYLQIAKAVAERSICLQMRRGFGAIIVTNDTIVSTGYAGPARGVGNCNEVGECIRNALKQKPYESYDNCPSVHAEENAVINAARHGSKVFGGVMYLFGMHSDGRISHGLPCARCRRVLINAGIKEIVTMNEKDQIIKYNVDDWIEEDSKAYIDNLKKIRK